MAHRQIEKRLAAQLLEATKSVLDHVSRWMVELNQTGKEPPSGLAKVYGRARRLRDYLHRSASAYGRTVGLDLSNDDEDLLVSCMVHHLGVVERELRTGKASEKGWLEEELKSLGQFAVELATRPVNKIPTREAADQTSPTVRTVLSAIARKTVRLPNEGAPLGRDPAASVGGWPATGASAVGQPQPGAPGPHSGHDLAATWSPDTEFHIEHGQTRAAEVEHAGGGFESPVPIGHGLTPQLEVQQVPVYPGFEPEPPGHAGAGVPASSPEPVCTPAAGLALLDPGRISDPRLRAMVAMDQRAFVATMAAEQYRLALVHLASLLEAAVVDHAIPRQRELGVKGPPETWRIERVLDTALGDRLGSRDRPYLLQLVAARHLVRPAVQLSSPMAVTSQSLQRVVAFVRRVLVELGYTGSASTADEPGLEAAGRSDLLAAAALPLVPPFAGPGSGSPTFS